MCAQIVPMQENVLYNQLNQFKKKLGSQVKTPFGSFYLMKYGNENNSNTNLTDFISNYKNDIDDFKLRVAQKHPILNSKVNNWYSLLDDNLKIVYANNEEFLIVQNGEMYIVKPEEYLLSQEGIKSLALRAPLVGLRDAMMEELERLKNIMGKTSNNFSKSKYIFSTNEAQNFIKLTDLDRYTTFTNMKKELENHKVSLNGKNYYLIEHMFNGTLKEDINTFYGKSTELEEIIESVNFESNFSYGCMINADSMTYEIVFNRLFAEYDFEKKELKIKNEPAVIANLIKNKKEQVSKNSFFSPPPMPRPDFNGYDRNAVFRYAAIRK